MQGNEKLILEKNGEKWLLNGKQGVRKSSINFITRILREMKIKSPVSRELLDSVVAGIKPVRVRTFEGRKRLSSFLVYKTRSNIYGNIMKMNEQSKPFIVYVPGHDNDIGSVFTPNELYWQPYTIFNLLPSEIARVDLVNFSDSSSSFAVVKNNGQHSLFSGNTELAGWDSTLVRRYLTYYTFIPFESWALNLGESEKKKIQTGKPAVRITVTPADGNQIVLTLWERLNEDGSPDSDRMFGKMDSSDEIFIVRYFDIDPVLKRKDYFFGES